MTPTCRAVQVRVGGRVGGPPDLLNHNTSIVSVGNLMVFSKVSRIIHRP
jgi:hypothetical protein